MESGKTQKDAKKEPYKGFEQHLKWLNDQGANRRKKRKISAGDLNNHIAEDAEVSLPEAHKKRKLLREHEYIAQDLIPGGGYRVWLTKKGISAIKKSQEQAKKRKRIKEPSSRKKKTDAQERGKKLSLDISKTGEITEISSKKRRELKNALRRIRESFSIPKPEITIFKLGAEQFYPCSTSEEEENRPSSYYTVLASLYSAGKNILRGLIKSAKETRFSLEGSQLYCLLPLDGNVLYIGKAKHSWLFSLKSKEFPRERLAIPEEKRWRTHKKDRFKLYIDRQVFTLFEHRKDEITDSIRLAYQMGITQLEVFQREKFATYLISTKKAFSISPFLMIRVEERKKETQASIFPVWFDYAELQLIDTVNRIKDVWEKIF